MKRAPFINKQSPERTLEAVILAGSLAWETSRAWRKDPDREDDVPPVVLGPDELADLDNLTIIRPDTLYVRVLRTGDILEEDLLKIAVKLAHANVQMARLMSPDGELVENWSGQLERLRQERPSDILPEHFRLDEEALWFDKLTERRDGESDVQPQRICSPLRVTAITCDSHDGSYGRLLEWHTTTGQLRRWAMPMAMLSGNGEELRRILLENGLTYISTRPALRSLLCEYISRSLPGRRVTCVEKTGWHCGVYVLPDEVIGPGGDNVILQGSHYLTGGFVQAGTLAEWQEQVAVLCTGNSRLVFAVCCALAAPLLRLTGTGGGGFHLRGESTDGKTTVMKVAASVCGGTDYWHSWRATGNALEGIASRHNDALLPLNELREVNPREAGMIAYMLANGQGKGRARTDGEVRNRRYWRLLLFSTGELSLAEHTERAGERLICDTDTERCDDLAMAYGVIGYTRLDALLQEEAIDVVSVTTPDPYHTESILTALRHGKHVLAEKPLATSVRECELIVEMAQLRDLLVGVDFHKRWDPAVMRIKAELEKPEAGRILRGHISMDDVISVPTEWLDWAGASSPVWFLGSHCFDLVRYLSGQEVVSVYAVGQKRLMVECGLDTFDSVQSLLTMADGSSWVVENSWVLPEGFPKDNDGRIEILCGTTYIRSTSQHRGLEITTPDKTLTPNSYFINYRNGVASGFGIDPINDFVRAVRHKAPYPVTAVDGLAVSRICEAVHRSLESGKSERPIKP